MEGNLPQIETGRMDGYGKAPARWRSRSENISGKTTDVAISVKRKVKRTFFHNLKQVLKIAISIIQMKIMTMTVVKNDTWMVHGIFNRTDENSRIRTLLRGVLYMPHDQEISDSRQCTSLGFGIRKYIQLQGISVKIHQCLPGDERMVCMEGCKGERAATQR